MKQPKISFKLFVTFPLHKAVCMVRGKAPSVQVKGKPFEF